MTDRDKVFDAIRNCITEPKCKDCPWEDCENVGHKRVDVPVTLMLDVLNVLKEQETVVRCKDCKFYTDPQICPVFGMDRYDDWFCAAGKRR